MDKVGNRQEHQAPRNTERLSQDEAPIVSQVIDAGDVSLRAMWSQLMRLMPQLTPEYEQTHQPAEAERQYQVAAVGASAVHAQPSYETAPATPVYSQNPVEQADFQAWDHQMSEKGDGIDLTAKDEPYQQPQYLNDAVNDAVAEAERLVAEAYKNDPYARPEEI
jgi:hypothetical protein